MRRATRSFLLASVASLSALAGGDAGAASGGPDAFGYAFVDQDDGATYGYVDITTTGTLVVMGSDQAATVALGAPFEFYGAPLLEIVAATSGFLTDDPAAAPDFTNDCPVPDPPSSGAGFRIYALHDDLSTSVFYQYFTEPQAAAVGYPGQASGISVVQWTGNHNGGGPVDFEAILFHDDLSVLTMVAADAEGGSGSTLGIQDPTASLGLGYACNTAMSLVPGATAVRYTLGPPRDSACCSPSPTGAPGCVNLTCQSVVCSLAPSCCFTDWDASCAALAQSDCPVLCGVPPAVTINEIRIDQFGPDNDEYFELLGPPGALLNDIQYIVLGDTPTGTIEAVVDLTGSVIPPSGLFVVTEDTFTIGPPADLVASLNFENLDTVTHMLVGGLFAALDDDLDVDGDGVLDTSPFIAVLDTVSFIEPDPGGELPYGPGSSCMPGPTCQQVDDGINGPFQVYRCPDGDGLWQLGNIDELALPPTDTPGAPNDCAGGFCGDGLIGMGEACDDMGESALCNATCSLSACGDGITNASAGELCDDGGESFACNIDCSPAACGDGIFNPSAGEACDDGGESSTCNVDCQIPECGDGNTDMLAGEECDDAGESATCDEDCTFVVCGDGTVNPTAGETCDDAGRSDMCDADCTLVDCGDGIVNAAAGEQCDGDGMGQGGETSTCDVDCTLSECGDGMVNPSAGEQCDTRGESRGCDEDCTPVECGDGLANAAAGEQCDDGNTADGDGCAADCTTERLPGTTTDTGADETMGSADSTGDDDSTTTSVSPPSTTAADSGSTAGIQTGTDADTDTLGAVPGDEGCNCRSGPLGPERTPWSVLAWLSLGIIGRRRPRHR